MRLNYLLKQEVQILLLKKCFLTSSGSLTISNELTINGNNIYFGNGTSLSNSSANIFSILAANKTIDIDSADMRIDLTGSQYITITGDETKSVNNQSTTILGNN